MVRLSSGGAEGFEGRPVSSLVLIPWAETAWSAAGRIAGRTPLPLTDVGQDQARSWAESISEYDVDVVYSSDERASVETAEIIAEKLDATHKTMVGVAEVDPGLWDGLTLDDLKRRHAKVFKKWYQDPSSVCPPEGEDLGDAQERLRGAVERVLRKNGEAGKAVVLGPVALSLIRCWLDQADLDQARSLVPEGPCHYERDAVIAPVGTAAAGESSDDDSQGPPAASETRDSG